MKKLVNIFLMIFFPFFFFGFALLEAGDKTSSPAPDFALTDLKGNVLSLSGFKDKIIFLNFWATWCAPCRQEIPDFVAAYEQLKEKGLVIIGVSVDRTSTDVLRSFVEKFKMTYPIAFATKKIIDDYQPGRFIPTTIIIDKAGKIRHKHVGLMDKETLQKYFSLLAEEK